MACVQNPDFGSTDPYAFFPNTPYFDDLTGEDCYPSLGSVYGGTVYGGSNPPTSTPKDYHTLDSILASVLSGFALLQHAPYVPTGNNPYNQPVAAPVVYPPTSGGNLGGGSGNLGANNASITAGTLGKVEAWVKKNPGASAIGGLVVAALFLPALMGKKK